MGKQDCIYFNLRKVNTILATLESALSVDDFNIIQSFSEKSEKKDSTKRKNI